MKRNLLIILTAVLGIIILTPAELKAQEEKEKKIEKKVEKKIKIVTVDESGERIIIDTVIKGGSDHGIIHLGKGAVYVIDSDKDHKDVKTEDGRYIIVTGDKDKTLSIYSKGDKELIGEDKLYIITKGDKDSFSIVALDEESEGDTMKIRMQIDEEVIYAKDGNIVKKSSGSEDHTYLVKAMADGEKKIKWTEKSKQLEDNQVHIIIRSKNELEDLIIDGDAVITIKDGKVKVDSEGLKMNSKKEGDSNAKKEK
jgi:uncharacterized Zn ribbon protein